MPRVKVNGVNIFYEITGEGPALALLHGWTGNHKLWKEQVPVFSKNYTVIMVDHRGHGESDKPRTGYSIQVFADDLHRVLDKLGISKTFIVGHSMGGMIAQKFYLSYPDKVRALILADTTSHGTGGTISFEEAGVLVQTLGFQSAVEQFFAETFFAEGTSEEIINWAKSEVLKTPQYVVEEGAKAMSQFDTTDRLSEIEVPTLIIHGDQDLAISVEKAKTLHEKIPNSKLKIIRGSGHFILLEKPDEFNKIVLEFLSKLES
ncbi:MAG: alpha/beta fold hydrolase [Candidatus Bathyarchaeia archaeon]